MENKPKEKEQTLTEFCEELFNETDTDNSGHIDKKELKALLIKTGKLMN